MISSFNESYIKIIKEIFPFVFIYYHNKLTVVCQGLQTVASIDVKDSSIKRLYVDKNILDDISVTVTESKNNYGLYTNNAISLYIRDSFKVKYLFIHEFMHYIEDRYKIIFHNHEDIVELTSALAMIDLNIIKKNRAHRTLYRS